MAVANLVELLERYERAQPKRARGGVYALSGFDYQIRVYLADFAEALVRGEGLEEAGEAFAHGLESLSDFTRQDAESGSLICVQVKRTLSRATLGAAGAEFAAIDCFLESEGLLSEAFRPRYEVAGRQVEDEVDWESVELPSKTRREHAELAERFELLKREGRLGPIRNEPDPWWRLIATVFRYVDDPFAFAREALDLCLSRGTETEGAHRVRESVAELYVNHRGADSTNARCLAPKDFEVQAAVSRELDVGAMPSIEMLRDRQYMPRAAQIEGACAGLEKLLRDREIGQRRVVDVFWIDGRSGCGKSVLLLQVMERMVRSGARVVWLEGNAGPLSSLILSLRGNVELDADLIFVDDLWDPQNREEIELRRIVEHVTRRGIRGRSLSPAGRRNSTRACGAKQRARAFIFTPGACRR